LAITATDSSRTISLTSILAVTATDSSHAPTLTSILAVAATDSSHMTSLTSILAVAAEGFRSSRPKPQVQAATAAVPAVAARKLHLAGCNPQAAPRA